VLKVLRREHQVRLGRNKQPKLSEGVCLEVEEMAATRFLWVGVFVLGVFVVVGWGGAGIWEAKKRTTCLMFEEARRDLPFREIIPSRSKTQMRSRKREPALSKWGDEGTRVRRFSQRAEFFFGNGNVALIPKSLSLQTHNRKEKGGLFRMEKLHQHYRDAMDENRNQGRKEIERKTSELCFLKGDERGVTGSRIS